VRRSLLVLGLSFTACSGGEAGSEMSWRSAASGDISSEQPSVLVRCENGRIGAYVVMEGADGHSEAQLVRIDLDSAPGC
jgi:hypothetical protein